ncbi:MAG: NrfD/PsrC family molybdoenzyme membrane anchor subunit [Candidatus Nanopelagicaceae bacterium]|nr:NrfD/PsrC family molybdoenzyme membrane anchor subunit [Candidatus Nanopelagicaceae bacterium]
MTRLENAGQLMQPSAQEAAMRPFKKASAKFWIAIGLLSAVVALGIFAWIVQLREGMGVSGFSNRSFWAIDLANVVTIIGVSYGGAVISAILLLTGASWRAPLARIAEGMAVVTVIIGAAFILPHLGRPDRLLYMLTQPNFRSPVFWDFVAITTYMVASIVFFFLPLIPDMAILRNKHPEELGRGRRYLYRICSQGWISSPNQHRVLRGAIGVVAILIIPLAVSVHSVLSWAFSLVSRPGWHESIWAPYFVIAALYSGVALVIIITAGFRRGYHLEAFITERHFVRLGFLMAALGATYLYLTFADILPGAYVGERGVAEVVHDTLLGDYAISFWTFIFAGAILPILLVALPQTRNTTGMAVAATLVVIAMWLKRLIMVSETSHYDQLTRSFGQHYQFTWVSISITLAGVAAIPLLLMLLFRVVPILAIDEIDTIAAEASAPPAPTTAKSPAGRGVGTIAGIFLLLIAAGAIGIGNATPAAADSSVPTITVTATASGPNISLTAAVKYGADPVFEADLIFYESTTMFKPGNNLVPVGRATTDLDGVAEVSYTAVVNGSKTVTVMYYFDPELPPTIGTTQVNVSGAVSPYVEREPELLAGAGRTLVSVLFSLVLVSFAIVIAQLVRVRRTMRVRTLN